MRKRLRRVGDANPLIPRLIRWMMTLHRVQRALCWLAVALFVPAAAPAQRSSPSLTAEKILGAIGVRHGGTVCEIGAGSGEMTIAAARVVGPNGRVFTSELGDSRISKLRDKVAASGLKQITVVAGEASQTNFPEAGCDGIFMQDVYHHLTTPAAMNQSIAASLKPGGRVAVIDFKPPGEEASEPGERARDGQHGVTPETVSREMKSAGLEPVSSERPAQRWFLLVFSKPELSTAR